MSLWAIVPVKPLRRGKSRLSGVLSEEERTILNFSMLAHTLEVAGSVAEIDQVLVISRDPAALALAREHDARTVQEERNSSLNPALRRATIVAQAYASDGVLILPADLPLLQKEDLDEIIRRAVDPPVMVIAPDRRRKGTNALLLRPPGTIDYAYGPNSFHNHVERGRRQGLRVDICDIPAVSLDLDLPEDLDLIRQLNPMQIKL